MKLLSDIIHKNYGECMIEGSLSSFDAGDLVCAVMKSGIPQYIAIQKAENIVCPMCGKSEGYKVLNGKELWWACRRRECIAQNSKKYIFIPKYKQQFDIMIEVGVPNRLVNADFINWNHSDSLKKDIIEFVNGNKDMMVITGSNGVGKSYVAVAAMREFYIKTNQFPRFYNLSDLYQKWLDEPFTY